MAKVVETTVSDNEISSTIDLELDGVPDKLKPRVKREVGEFLVEQTLMSLGDAKSPISRAPYKKTLSKDYKKEKTAAGRSGVADLEFSGDMKDSFKFRSTDEGIKIGHFGKEAGKADGHNNFSGQSDLPERRYLPKEGDKYKAELQAEVDNIIKDAVVDARPISESKLKRVETKSDFWALLTMTYEGLTKREIIGAVSRNESFVNTLTTLGLIKWLK
jgi:hypothetical protein